MNQIRHIATSENSMIFLTAEYEKKVYAWDIDTESRLSAFNTVLQFGGERLAISHDGALCVAASYNKLGICAYETRTGNLIWKRNDIDKIQTIKTNYDKDELFVGTDKNSFILNCRSGDVIKTLENVKNWYGDRFGYNITVNKNGSSVQYDGHTIELSTFAILDVCATEKGVALSSAGDGIYFFDRAGELRWFITPNPGSEHFLKIAYLEKWDIIIAILYKYTNNRVPPYIVLYGIHVETGEIEYRHGLQTSSVFGFIGAKEKLICSSGEIISFLDGKPQMTRDFCWG